MNVINKLSDMLPICDGCKGKDQNGCRTNYCEFAKENQDLCLERTINYIKEHNEFKLRIENAMEKLEDFREYAHHSLLIDFDAYTRLLVIDMIDDIISELSMKGDIE